MSASTLKKYILLTIFSDTLPIGYRIGKGEGYADMEYAIMVTMGAVNQDTVVVSTVHDCQVTDIPDELTDEHDLMVKQS